MSMRRLVPLLNVESVPRSVGFYRDHLGFKVVREWEDDGRIRWASVASGDIQLMLNEPHGVSSDERRTRGPYSDAVFYFHVADVEELHRRLAAAGLDVGKLKDESYGFREFYLRDPDGYELGFGTPLRAEAAV